MVIYTASASVNRINIDPNIGITIDTVSELNPTPVESAANRKYTYIQYRVIYACSVRSAFLMHKFEPYHPIE